MVGEQPIRHYAIYTVSEEILGVRRSWQTAHHPGWAGKRAEAADHDK